MNFIILGKGDFEVVWSFEDQGSSECLCWPCSAITQLSLSLSFSQGQSYSVDGYLTVKDDSEDRFM